jgi:hypothetical protein
MPVLHADVNQALDSISVDQIEAIVVEGWPGASCGSGPRASYCGSALYVDVEFESIDYVDEPRGLEWPDPPAIVLVALTVAVLAPIRPGRMVCPAA